MDLPSKKVLGQIKSEFTFFDLTSDIEDTQLLEDLAEKHGVDYKVLLAKAKSENWLALREMKKASFRNKLEQATEQELEKAAVDVARIQTNFLRESIETVNTKLPAILEYLDGLMMAGELGDKAAVSYASLIIKLRQDLQKQMGEALKDKPNEVQQALPDSKQSDFLNTLPTKAQIIDATRKQEDYEIQEFEENAEA